MQEECQSAGGECHLIYWQQWLSGCRRGLITSSVMLRLDNETRAESVCKQMLQSLELEKDKYPSGRLVLVGSLFSLPEDFVQYEYEHFFQSAAMGGQDEPKRSMLNGAAWHSFSPTDSSSAKPFHIVRTLAMAEHPIEVRLLMAEHLKTLEQQRSGQRSTMPWKLRWYFVPDESVILMDPHAQTIIPSYLELDGYCTSMDEEVDDEMSDSEHGGEDTKNSGVTLAAAITSRFRWLQQQIEGRTRCHQLEDALKSHDNAFEAGLLAHYLSFKRDQCFAGFLVKQSRRDHNVWKRMLCVITDQHMWFATRIHGNRKTARYGRIRLARALLLESTPEYPQLDRVPNSFELVTAKGNTHVFRAASKQLQLKWIQALSYRILQSFENSMMDSAQVIAENECSARSGRMAQFAAESAWAIMPKFLDSEQEDHDTKAIGAVIRWGLDVAEYRECVRHIQSLLFSKAFIVGDKTASEAETVQKHQYGSLMENEAFLKNQVDGCWTHAESLLARATHTVLQFYPRLPRGLESICRHIESVISGRKKNAGLSGGATARHFDIQMNPPPVDLFDHLLNEMQQRVMNLSMGAENIV